MSLYIIHAPTCFDIYMSSSGSTTSAPYLVTRILEMRLLKLQFNKLIKILVVFIIKSTVSYASSVYLWLHLYWSGEGTFPRQTSTPTTLTRVCIRSHKYTLLARETIASNRFYYKHD